MKFLKILALSAILPIALSCAAAKKEQVSGKVPKRLQIPKKTEVSEALARATSTIEEDPYQPDRMKILGIKEEPEEEKLPEGVPPPPPNPEDVKGPPPGQAYEEKETVMAYTAVTKEEKPKLNEAETAALISGPFSREAVKRLIEARVPDVNYCYELVVNSGVKIEGTVTILFVIGDDGRVKNVYVQELTINHEGIVSCVVNTVSGWRFPKPEGIKEVEITYPFVFKLIK